MILVVVVQQLQLFSTFKFDFHVIHRPGTTRGKSPILATAPRAHIFPIRQVQSSFGRPMRQLHIGRGFLHQDSKTVIHVIQRPGTTRGESPSLTTAPRGHIFHICSLQPSFGRPKRQLHIGRGLLHHASKTVIHVIQLPGTTRG